VRQLGVRRLQSGLPARDNRGSHTEVSQSIRGMDEQRGRNPA
jgi:hypothetical protein